MEALLIAVPLQNGRYDVVQLEMFQSENAFDSYLAHKLFAT